jgi:lipoprotein-anchoring transpeptidase ErfK/SrfK
MRTVRFFLALVAISLFAACGGGGGSATEKAAPTSPRSADPTVTTSASIENSETTDAEESTEPTDTGLADQAAVVARSDGEVAVFAAPGDDEPAMVLPATTGFGSARALLVEESRGDWLEVYLPVRPNGSTGWVKRADVTLKAVDEAVLIDLSARTLTVTLGQEVVVTTSVAIGAPDVPTPTGRFYVVDKLSTGSTDSAYGPFAFGLSGHSETLTEFAGGDGQIGIHGTNQPSSIGEAVSHGCVRVPNDVAVELNDLLPLGTPVTIV